MDRRMLVLAGLAAPMTVPVAAWWIDRWGRRPADLGPWDALVVAGCRVRPDGSPSPALQRRVACAAALWHTGVAPLVVTTGGQTTPGCPAEAIVAAQALGALGVPATALRIEGRSKNTSENARFSGEILGSDARVLVVSCHYHRWRCARLFAPHFTQVGTAGPVATGGAAWARVLRELGSVVDAGWNRRV